MKLWGILGALATITAILNGNKTGKVRYKPIPGWGPHWGNEPPKDAPANLRHPSEPGVALPFVEEMANEMVNEDFARAMVALADNESRGTFALPARKPYSIKDGWGVFQFNIGAWNSLRSKYYGWRARNLPNVPWEATPGQELYFPIRRYAAIWKYVVKHGGQVEHAARAVRLWHRAPALAKRYIDQGAATGDWNDAWHTMKSGVTNQRLLAAITRSENDAYEVANA